MKTALGFLLCTGVLYLLLLLPASGQEKPPVRDISLRRVSLPFSPPQSRSESLTRYRISGKKASQYTAEDWGKLIDSTWGPGQPAATQLTIFDTFWNAIDQKWAGFPNLSLNWDSLRNVYRPQIGSGLSRGRFFALMSRMSHALLEPHTWIGDQKVDTTFGDATWHYKSGVPLLVIGTGALELLGAAVTPMPDSSGLVYRVVPGNPLGLAPGDLVLGYDGIPWKRLYAQLLNNGVPVSVWWSLQGSTPESESHMVLSGVGCNWGLFDTIDVVKYSTGDTLHLPTAPLATLTQSVWATDQVPIAGVPMPQGCVWNGTGPAMSWGVVQGTNIGYVYVWDWYTDGPQLFHDAIHDLRYNKKVEGLVIDFRTNWGGIAGNANGGLSELFNFDPTANMSTAKRNSVSNHMSFSLSGNSSGFGPTADPFERPIAVLIGPACWSSGDDNAFFMRFHPMARFFGKPTNGSFVGDLTGGLLAGDWAYQLPASIGYSNVLGEGYLIHKGVQPDEEVWVTRDGVAKGEDDVVKRAMEWITTLTHAHSASVDRPYYRPGIDSISVKTLLANPLNHQSRISAIITDTNGTVRDSAILYNDGLHGDGIAGDSVWGLRIPAPADENIFAVSVRTDDITNGSYRRLPNVQHFTTAGPLKLDSIVVTKFLIFYQAKPYLRNDGKTLTIKGAAVRLRSNDSWITGITPETNVLPDLLPGAAVTTGTSFRIGYNTATFPGYFNLITEMSVDGILYWTDSSRVVLTNVKDEEALPTEYSLAQNFPNPFNPSTDINYQIPKQSLVTVKIFDLLDREVATLVNEKKDAGRYSVQWDASKRASGVYFYTLQAGPFRETKRMILLK